MQGVGLALLRLEHVEGATQGELGLEFESDEKEEGKEKIVKKWGVTSWWPHWWPPRSEGV